MDGWKSLLKKDPKYWLNWTVICGLGEFFGIGFAAGVAVLHFSMVGEPRTVALKLLVIAVMMLAGAVEGLITGYFQWSVLKKRFSEIRARNWLGLTALGAVIAWMLGMIPSTFFAPEASSAAAIEFSTGQIVLLSTGMGVVLGALFGVFQWIELKKHTVQAGWWIIANALGWTVGLAIIFIGASQPANEAGLAAAITIGAISGLLAGLAVGAVTGIFLVRMEPRRQ